MNAKGKNKRQYERFDDIGRVDSPEMCPFSGILEDISEGGCRVRFPGVAPVDSDADYNLKITPTRKTQGSSFVLIAQPARVTQSQGFFEVAFSLLHSPGKRQLMLYLAHLASDTADDDALFEPECSIA
ncbi:MAG: hypothetical protein Ta2A_20610 [Treponemataceae bacterium]|nr:MAG: hypothetical protein Ta2A_20610 [Treponemataceae bacterium]